jgi:chromosome segregation ATPase
VLYLAEVVQKKGFMGNKSELKLLAFQKGEQWSAAGSDDLLAAEEANNHKDGALVLVDVVGSGADRKIKRIQEGTRQIVQMLQSYSRQQEKSKSQEEEIQQWMESLTFQSQELNRRETELNRRETELEDRYAQLEQREQSAQNLDGKQQQVQESQAAMERFQQELQQRSQALERDRSQIEQERNSLEQQVAHLQQQLAQQQGQAALDPQQAAQLQQLVNQVATAGGDVSGFVPAVETCLQIVAVQESLLSDRWSQVEQERQSLSDLQGWVAQETQDLAQAWQQWHDRQAELDQARIAAQAGEWKRSQVAAIEQQLQGQVELRDRLGRLAEGELDLGDRVDVAALEAKPLPELQDLVNQLQRDLEKASRFVNDQEEELQLQHQTLDELNERIQQASEFDRLALENELADEREHYQTLNESLVGSRRNLQEREEFFRVHEMILCKRQGLSPKLADGAVDLSPAIAAVETQLAKLSEWKQQVATELASLEDGDVTQQLAALQQEQEALKTRDRELQAQRVHVGDLEGRLNITDHTVQPLQEQVTGLREHLESLVANLSSGGDSSERDHAVQQIQSILAALT